MDLDGEKVEFEVGAHISHRNFEDPAAAERNVKGSKLNAVDSHLQQLVSNELFRIDTTEGRKERAFDFSFTVGGGRVEATRRSEAFHVCRYQLHQIMGKDDVKESRGDFAIEVSVFQ
ncbi:hypothetical protein QR680_006963 [Steinernema hermaphroditum]|uniref:Uncharacterized protein n=1 Tax=Steinernema hermaphroditum TaxID=289476 RepID=A0AA39LXZ5_9BILA|nr:hypothetical protein QR680_006963 [Steinernema hermaphroditum]